MNIVALTARALLGLITGLVAWPTTALATHPGDNGHIAYTKLVDKDTPTSRRAVFLDNGVQISQPTPRSAGQNDNDSSPTFSPDGKQLAFIRRDGATLQYAIYIVNADGSGLRRLVGEFDSRGVPTPLRGDIPSSLTWSPDGQTIGYLAADNLAPYQYTNAIRRVAVAAGDPPAMGVIQFNPAPFSSTTGIDWGSGLIRTRCASLTDPNVLFCGYSTSGSLDNITAYRPTDVPQIPPGNQLPLTSIPRSMPDSRGGDPRVMFLWSFPLDTGGTVLNFPFIASMKPAVAAVGIQGSDIVNHTPGAESVMCTSKVNGVTSTTYRTRYNYGNPVPSPDGKYFAATRSEYGAEYTQMGNDTRCTFAAVGNGLYVFRNVGGVQRLVDSADDVGGEYAWQPSPANLVIHVSDGHGDELQGLKVELRDIDDDTQVRYGSPVNSSGGTYLFEDVVPGRYLARATLATDEFEIRHEYPSADAVWAEVEALLPPGAEKVEIDFPFQDSDLNNASIDNSQWDRLDDMAAIYYQLRRFVEWTKANLTPAPAPKVNVYAFSATDRDGALDLLTASHFGDSMWLGAGISLYQLRDDASDIAPVNGEWHEYGHHLHDTFISPPCVGEVNHAGYSNPSTCDSLQEGIPIFLAAMANQSSNYAGTDLEANTKAWGSRFGDNSAPIAVDGLVSTEDYAAAALLWDLVDGSADAEFTQAIGLGGAHVAVNYFDNANLTLRDLWGVLTSGQIATVAGLANALHLDGRYGNITLDLDYDLIADVTAIDPVFLMHGFFRIVNDQLINANHQTYHYDVEGTRQPGSTSASNASVGTSGHNAFYYAGQSSPNIDPRFNIQLGPRANLDIQARDASGRPLQGADLTLTLHYPGRDEPLNAHLTNGSGNLVHLELPMYFDYLLPVGATALPACDPAHDVYVSVTLTATLNGYPSTNAPAFDNCTYVQGMMSANGPAAAAYTMNFPDDSTAPVSSIATSSSAAVVGQYTNGVWTVGLSCDDPVIAGFASGCVTTEYSLDGAGYVPFADGLVISAPGLHTLEYRSRDAAGNEEAASSVSLGVAADLDTNPPFTFVDSDASVPAHGGITMGYWTVYLSCTDFDYEDETTSGCARTEYRVDGGALLAYADPFTISGVGTHTIQVHSFDAAGNEEPLRTASLRIIPPTDVDGDGVLDDGDNCLLLANADQRDTNDDGFGNRCDADFNNNFRVDSNDASRFKVRFGMSAASTPDLDLNGNGMIDMPDLAILRGLFGKPPGPRGAGLQ